MNISTNQYNETTIVFKLEGNFLGEYQGDDFSKKLDECLEGDIRNIILDIAEMKYINSVGLNVLLNGHKAADKLGKPYILCNVGEQVEKLLHITKLDSILNIAASIDDAVDSLNNA